MGYADEQLAAKRKREREAGDIAIELRHVQQLHTDCLTNVAMVFCALTNPPAYSDVWSHVWLQAQENHDLALIKLDRCSEAVTALKVYYPKLHSEVREAVAGHQLLSNCVRAIVGLHASRQERQSASTSKKPRAATPKPKATTASPGPQSDERRDTILANLRAMSGDALRKALDKAAEISIGHAARLFEAIHTATVVDRLAGLPKLSTDAKGVEVTPGVDLGLGLVKVTESRLGFAVRYLEVKGLIPSLQKYKLPAKVISAIDSDVAGVSQEALLSLTMGGR